MILVWAAIWKPVPCNLQWVEVQLQELTEQVGLLEGHFRREFFICPKEFTTKEDFLKVLEEDPEVIKSGAH